jgi:oligopeptide transport system ATP-binding protein
VTATTPAAQQADPERAAPILEVNNLVKHYPLTGGGVFRRRIGDVHAVCDISFSLKPGETLGLVGESGCGKSTTGKAILQLTQPTSGEVNFEGENLVGKTRKQLRRIRRDLQVVFQDPYASLNPRIPVNDIVAEPLIIHGLYGKQGKERVRDLLTVVGLNPEHGNRYAHEFSGGQRQRIGIARALALEPKVLVLDEPVSALDVSIQAGVVNLLEELQERLGLAYLFIAHDLSVVRHISDRVAVMYLGKIVETGTRDQIYERASHPYTQALMSAVPIADPKLERQRRRIVLEGDVPSPVNPPSGCRFRTRCPLAHESAPDSVEREPPLIHVGGGHHVACHLVTGARAPQLIDPAELGV